MNTRAKLNVMDVECILDSPSFRTRYDKVEFVDYLAHYGLISEKTKNEVLKTLE